MEYIKSNPDWDLIRAYNDGSASGYSTEQRSEFKRMMDAAFNNEFDIIVVKSVSCFSRNMAECLMLLRQLKENGINVYFRNENKYLFETAR